MEHDPEQGRPGCSLEAYLEETTLTEGQRRRLRLLQTVEAAVVARVEQLCTGSCLEVTDAAVLVVSPTAHAMFFDDSIEPPEGASVLLGHRAELHDFLHAVLPPSDDAPFDPYVDLIEPAPPGCVRVLIVDGESLTVMSYGAFVTLRLDASTMPEA